MGRVVVAPDRFKGSLTAAQVAEHLSVGLRAAHPDLDLVQIPIADGGDGTVDAAVAAGFVRHTFLVTGPLGEPVAADVAMRDDVAVVELAQASGMSIDAGPQDPLRATSRGTGELLVAVRALGCRRVILGLGGSACTDGGAGMAQALGVKLRDGRGIELPPGGAALRDLDTVDPAGVPRDWRGVDVIIAADVNNPLYGPTGAARVYGPHKGAGPVEVDVLDEGLRRLAHVVGRDARHDHADDPGAGAAGGVGYAAMTFLKARMVSGINVLLELTGFTTAVAEADLVVTGEGRLDVQTLYGKASAGVAARARAARVPTVAVAGLCSLSPDELAEAGFSAVHLLSALESDPAVSMRRAGRLLERLAADIDVSPPPTDHRFRSAAGWD